MNTKKLPHVYIALLFLACLVMGGLWYIAHTKKYVSRDYPEIRKEGVLKIVTSYNSIDLYVDGDTITGFQYNLSKSIEKLSGLKVEIYLENNMEACMNGLLDQTYDVIARNIPVTTKNQDELLFTNPISLGKQVLVQRKETDGNNSPIRNQIDLARKTVYIPANSPNTLRLKNLGEEIADTIYVIQDEKYDSEQLIYKVAHGEIDYAVVDQEIAQKNISDFPQIDIETDISFTQFQAWALRKDSPILLDSLNSWIQKSMIQVK